MCQLKTGLAENPIFPTAPALAKKPFSPSIGVKRPSFSPTVSPLSKKICLKQDIVTAPTPEAPTLPTGENDIEQTETNSGKKEEATNAPVVEIAATAEEIQRAALALTLKLMEASRTGNLDEIKRLVEEENADVTADYIGYTALHYAVFYNHQAIAEYLIEMGANVDAKNPAGVTPLAWAVDRNHVDLVGYLLEAEADPSIATKEGITPLHKAARDGNHEMVAALLSINTEEAEWTKVNAQTELGYTPAYFAAFQGSVEILVTLLEYGADFNICSHQNVAPLHRALTKKHEHAARYILQNGANVDKKDNNGRTALHTAAFTNQVEMVKELLLRNAQLLPDVAGRSPLDLAKLRNHEQVVQLLEAHQADHAGEEEEYW